MGNVVALKKKPHVAEVSSYLEDRILQIFRNNEIIKERKDENTMLMNEVEAYFEHMNEDELIFQLPTGEYAILRKTAKIRETLDREALAHEMLVSKDELKTPFDYSMFTKKGMLTPDMITKHTHTKVEVKIKLTKRKTKPRKRK